MKRLITSPLPLVVMLLAAGAAFGHTVLVGSAPPQPPRTEGGPVLVIPALGVRARLVGVGATGPVGRASLSIPGDVHAVGWWNGIVTHARTRSRVPAPAPGDPGVALIAGHVDSARSGPGALVALRRLRPGEVIRVVGLHHRTTVWRVSAWPRLTLKSSLPAALFATTGRPRLAIVTCGGAFDVATGHYVDNVIVWARPA